MNWLVFTIYRFLDYFRFFAITDWIEGRFSTEPVGPSGPVFKTMDPTALPPPAALPLPPPKQPLTTQDPSQGIEIPTGVQKEKMGDEIGRAHV